MAGKFEYLQTKVNENKKKYVPGSMFLGGWVGEWVEEGSKSCFQYCLQQSKILNFELSFDPNIFFPLFSAKTFSIGQEVSATDSLPFGMNRAYLDIVRPSAILRTWISHPPVSNPQQTNHLLNITVLFSTSLDGVVDAKTQMLSTPFSNSQPPISSDLEFSLFLADFADFDTMR